METELTPEEVIKDLTTDTLTPSPELNPTTEQVEQIKVLLNAGYLPIDIFINFFLPLEWVTKVQEELLAPIE